MIEQPLTPAAEEGGAPEVLDAERASAMPTSPKVAPGRIQRSNTRLRPIDLMTTQSWFLDAVAWPGTLRGGLGAASRRHQRSLEELCTPGPQLSAFHRVEVYHYAYRARLIEALSDDFGALRHALGPQSFEAFAARVIALSPSRTPNLNEYGRVVVDTLRGGKVRVPNRGFLLALAELEWALVEAVHAAPAPRLNPAELRAIAPERWPFLRFSPSASLTILASDWPANRFLQAFRRGESPTIPERMPSATAIYRQGYSVWRMDLSPLTHGLLSRLVAGVPLGEALAPVEGKAGEDQVMRWFESWVGGGVFASVTDV